MEAYQNQDSGIIQAITPQRTFKILYLSDGHFDHPASKTRWMHRMLKKHKDAYIIIGGDSIDVMNFKIDRRHVKGDVIEQLQNDDYANRLVDYLRKEIIEPYRDRIICWNRGNHDNMVIKKMEVDLLSWALDGYNIPIGDFSGYIIITHKSSDHARNSILYYQHAPTSGGRRSKGMLSVDILKGQAPDADIILTEHIHENWSTLQKVQKLDTRSKNYVNKYMWFVQNTTLKAEDEGRKNGFYHEKIKGSGTLQGMNLLHYELIRGKKRNKLNVKPELIPCIE